MVTDLEKQFFDTFGIEQIEYTQCTSMGCKHIYGDCDNCQFHNVYKIDYPPISDRILLELIRIIGKKPFGYLQCENTYSTNLGDTRDMITVESDDLKEGLLTLAIQKKVVLRIKQQVQALFEEE